MSTSDWGAGTEPIALYRDVLYWAVVAAGGSPPSTADVRNPCLASLVYQVNEAASMHFEVRPYPAGYQGPPGMRRSRRGWGRPASGRPQFFRRAAVDACRVYLPGCDNCHFRTASCIA